MSKSYKIGDFANKTGLTPKAIRLYEKKAILFPNKVCDNGYRLYGKNELKQAQKIKSYKELGFTLLQIKSLLAYEKNNKPFQLEQMLQQRLSAIYDIENSLHNQKSVIKNILSSINNKQKLSNNSRRYIMSKLKQVSILVTGYLHLEETVSHVSKLTQFKRQSNFPNGINFEKNNIYLIHENEVNKYNYLNSPDIIIFNNITTINSSNYMSLYKESGPHMSTVFNADDKPSVKLAGNKQIQKGRIFYFSKRKELEKQIFKIGGVVASNNKVNIYGFNLKPEIINIDLGQNISYSLLSSIAGLLDIGLNSDQLIASS